METVRPGHDALGGLLKTGFIEISPYITQNETYRLKTPYGSNNIILYFCFTNLGFNSGLYIIERFEGVTKLKESQIVSNGYVNVTITYDTAVYIDVKNNQSQGTNIKYSIIALQ